MSSVRDLWSGGGWAWSTEELELLNERYEIGTGPVLRDHHVEKRGPLDDDWQRPRGVPSDSLRTAIWTAEHYAREAVKSRVVDAETGEVVWTSWEDEPADEEAA